MHCGFGKVTIQDEKRYGTMRYRTPEGQFFDFSKPSNGRDHLLVNLVYSSCDIR